MTAAGAGNGYSWCTGPRFPYLGTFLNVVGPSAQSSDGDASSRQLGGGAGAGAREPRRRQKPVTDFRGHLQRVSQEPAWPAQDGAAGFALRLPAAALHDQSEHGRRAGELPRLQRRHRYTDAERRLQGAKQEAKGDAKPANPAEQLDRWGRRQHPATANQEPKGEPSARPDESEVPAQAAGSDGRKSAKQKMSRRGKPGAEEPPKAEATPLGDASKETAKESAAKEEAKPEPAKPEPAKPSAETPAQSANVEPAGETSMTRPDPVPPVTPAPAAEAPAPVATVPSGSSALAPATAATPLTSLPPATADVSAAAVGTTTEAPAVPLPSKPAPAPAVTAAAPTLPPVTPAGPPVPPTSQ